MTQQSIGENEYCISGHLHIFKFLKHINALEVQIFFRASFLHPITDTDSMQGHAAQINFKVEILLNNIFKHQADTIIRKQRILKENLGCIFVSYLLTERH